MTAQFKVLALNPFHGGSHKAFLENWISRSRHQWDLLTLPPRKWKWRMRFAAVDLLPQIEQMYRSGSRWDVIFCTSMLNVAELRSLAPFLNDIPIVVYFHENQLTYPESRHHRFNAGLAAINIKTALSADGVWFNSAFHKNDFLSAARRFLDEHQSQIDFDKLQLKSKVEYQAVEDAFVSKRPFSPAEPLKLVWAARWEREKNPGLLFLALRRLKEQGINFKIAVLGEQMRTVMDCFKEAETEFCNEITHFGFAESRDAYRQILHESDIFISTAEHEFFGISAVEAVAARCLPVVPAALAYPEVLEDFKEFFYKPGSSVKLADKIVEASSFKDSGLSKSVEKYLWSKRAVDLDKSLTVYSI